MCQRTDNASRPWIPRVPGRSAPAPRQRDAERAPSAPRRCPTDRMCEATGRRTMHSTDLEDVPIDVGTDLVMGLAALRHPAQCAGLPTRRERSQSITSLHGTRPDSVNRQPRFPPDAPSPQDNSDLLVRRRCTAGRNAYEPTRDHQTGGLEVKTRRWFTPPAARSRCSFTSADVEDRTSSRRRWLVSSTAPRASTPDPATPAPSSTGPARRAGSPSRSSQTGRSHPIRGAKPERSLAWIHQHSRCVRDYERLAEHHETTVGWAMIYASADASPEIRNSFWEPPRRT